MDYNQKLTVQAQNLRKNMTLEERILWYHYLKHYPIQFRRQYVIGSYIVDFYCHQARLVIELDGSQHYDQSAMKYDEKRTEFLEKQGITVMRFTNTDIKNNLRGVCEQIDAYMMDYRR